MENKNEAFIYIIAIIAIVAIVAMVILVVNDFSTKKVSTSSQIYDDSSNVKDTYGESISGDDFTDT